jgi:hypothetical protein
MTLKPPEHKSNNSLPSSSEAKNVTSCHGAQLSIQPIYLSYLHRLITTSCHIDRKTKRVFSRRHCKSIVYLLPGNL